MRRVGAFLGLIVLLCLCVRADGWTIFVNNRPFNGEKSGGPDKILLAADVLAACTDVGLKVEGGQVTLKGEPFPCVMQGANLMVDARELATRVGGRYTVNKEMQSVDIYLLGNRPAADPGGAAVGAKCIDLCKHPEKYVGKVVTVTGELMLHQNLTDEGIKAGWPSGYIRQTVKHDLGEGYYNVDVITGSRFQIKEGTTITVTGVFTNPDNRPVIKARSVR